MNHGSSWRPQSEEALEILSESIDDDDLPKETAIDLLQTEGFTEADATDIIQELLLSGRLYEVDSQLFITPVD